MGVERIGDESAEADAELLAMTVECLLAAGLKDFQVSVGQVDYFKSLLKEAEIPQETEKRLRELISQKNYFGVDELVQEQKIPKELAAAFCELPQMFGSAEILEKAKSLTQNMRALEAVSRLEEIYEILKIYGYEKYITFDFGLLSKYQYYTGIIFQAYTYGTGEPLVKGGRYNELMKHFGKPAASIGFAIVIDTLLLALSSQKISLEKEDNLVVLTYKKEERAQAIREAQKLRAEGKCVTLRLEKETEQP
jgi:ATP phosphoribosyltransferase regulatory subunit